MPKPTAERGGTNGGLKEWLTWSFKMRRAIGSGVLSLGRFGCKAPLGPLSLRPPSSPH